MNLTPVVGGRSPCTGPLNEVQLVNTRVIIVGVILVGLAIAFFFGMATVAPTSNDPAALMQTAGTVSGVVGALGIVLAVFGALRKTP
jgi:hypothetical protein